MSMALFKMSCCLLNITNYFIENSMWYSVHCAVTNILHDITWPQVACLIQSSYHLENKWNLNQFILHFYSFKTLLEVQRKKKKTVKKKKEMFRDAHFADTNNG